MATKEKEAPVKEVARTNGAEVTNSLALNGKTVTREDVVKALADADLGELDSGYLVFEPGNKKRVFFVGWKEIPGLGEKAGEKVKAAIFVTDTGKEQINADAVIVSYFQRQPIGVMREITCKGVNKSNNGEYKTFDFRELNVKK